MTTSLLEPAAKFAHSYFVTALGVEKGSAIFDLGLGLPEAKRVDFYKSAIVDLENLRRGEKIERTSAVRGMTRVKCDPVDIKTFVEDQYFMDSKNVLFPKVMECLVEMNNGMYQEAVLTGGIGTGKSTLALYSTAYQLYCLSCFRNPHELFDLDPSSEIVFIFQSINAKLAKAVDYDRFKAMITRSPYFNDQFAFNKDILSELQFPSRIIVKPVSGQETGAIGQNVIGGIIDEMNFMAVVENSKASRGNSTFDQATALYDSIAMRRKSRFMKKGVLPGLLCLVSSKRYPGQFTDRKEAEAKREIDRTGKTSIYIYDKREWDVKPLDRFSGNWFTLFIGDENKKPRIMGVDEEVDDAERHLLMDIPLEYRVNFEADIMKALRDIAGVSTLAHHPFIVERDTITKAQRSTGIIFGRETVDFRETKLQIFPDQFYLPNEPRFVHCDLAISGDSAGLAVGMVDGFLMGSGGLMPKIRIDGLLEVKPPLGGEILFYKLRDVILTLKKLGLNIKWITFDQFQSTDSMQVLRQQGGFAVGSQSVDSSTHPYDFVKNALYEGRLNMPRHKKCALELAGLEKDVKSNRIDHPPHGCGFGTVKVYCLDGLSRSFEELTADYVQGVQHMGLTWDSASNCARPALLEKPHITKYVQGLVEVEFDNGLSVKFTPDHLFMLHDGSYVEAQHLTPEMDLQF